MFQALNHRLIALVVPEKHTFNCYTSVGYQKASQALYVGLLVCLHFTYLESCVLQSKFILTSPRMAVDSGEMPRIMHKQDFYCNLLT